MTLNPLAGVQILADFDSKWTLRDLFHDVEAHESFSYVYVLLGFWVGGPGEIRTHDLFHAMEARSQLRHRPVRGTVFEYSTKGDEALGSKDLSKEQRAYRGCPGVSTSGAALLIFSATSFIHSGL